MTVKHIFVRMACFVIFSVVLLCRKAMLSSGVMLAQEQDAPSPASKAMSSAYDAESFAAIGASSAAASQAWLYNRLGRTDVEVLCPYPPQTVCHITFAAVCGSVCIECTSLVMTAPRDTATV